MKRSIKIILTLVLIVNLSMVEKFSANNIISADSLKNVKDEIKELEQEEQELKTEQSELHSKKKDTEKDLDGNLNKQEKVSNEIEEIDQKLQDTNNLLQSKEKEIQSTTNHIEKLESEIAQLKSEIDILSSEMKDLQKRIKKREVLLKERLRSLQQNGGQMKYIEVILGSQSFADFISRSLAVTTIMAQDKTIMDEHEEDQITLQDKKQVVENSKDKLETNKKEQEDQKIALEGQKNELVSLKGQLDQQMVEKDHLMVKLEEEYNHLEEYTISLEDEQKIMSEQVSALEKAKQVAEQKKGELEQLAREKAAREEAAREKAARAQAEKEEKENQDMGDANTQPTPPNTINEGIFIWPTIGTRISSPYDSNRLHPVYNEPRPHNGVDIPNNIGTPIYAAASGVVYTARYMGGYGNTVIVKHWIDGKAYDTVYAHLSRILVSPGQEVKQGDIVAEMGSTGVSTGPHLHFEVHVGGFASGGGNTVNPLSFY